VFDFGYVYVVKKLDVIIIFIIFIV
jgi:hypothetical protein